MVGGGGGGRNEIIHTLNWILQYVVCSENEENY